MKTLTDTDKAYLAALIDGEGCISIARHKTKESVSYVYGLRVMVCMTDDRTINACYEMTGLGSLYRQSRKDKPGTSDTLSWQIRKREAVLFLGAIKDYLILKRDQAELALEFAKIGTERRGKHGVVTDGMNDTREAYWTQMHNLKHRGNHSLPVPKTHKSPQLPLF